MRQPSLLRRYILFSCGVLCAALGIALITLAGMGTSAVSSLSYVLTFVFPGLSLGVFTFLVNCLMLVGQVAVAPARVSIPAPPDSGHAPLLGLHRPVDRAVGPAGAGVLWGQVGGAPAGLSLPGAGGCAEVLSQCADPAM